MNYLNIQILNRIISTQNIINIIILQSAHTPYYQKSPCRYISPAHTRRASLVPQRRKYQQREQEQWPVDLSPHTSTSTPPALSLAPTGDPGAHHHHQCLYSEPLVTITSVQDAVVANVRRSGQCRQLTSPARDPGDPL